MNSVLNNFLILKDYCNNCNYLFRTERRKNELFLCINIIAIIIYQGLEDTWSEAVSNECSPKLSHSQFRLVHVTMFLSAEKAWLGVSHKKCRNEGSVLSVSY